MKIKIAAISSVLILAVGVIAYGFGTEKTEVRACRAEHKAYITAHFRETTMGMCSDYDGGMKPCTRTNSWTRSASKVNNAITVNGKLASGSGVYDGLIYKAKMPSITNEYKHDLHFNHYSYNSDINYQILFSNYDHDNVDREQFASCSYYVGETVAVKTFYGSIYSTVIGQ